MALGNIPINQTLKTDDVNVKGNFGNVIQTLLQQYANPEVAPVKGEGWNSAWAARRYNTRKIKARRDALKALTAILTGNMKGETSRDLTKMTTEANKDIANIRGQYGLEKVGLANEGQMERLNTELGWREKQADITRGWKERQARLQANRNLVSNALLKGAKASPELWQLYGGSQPDESMFAGQQLVPTATQKPLGYGVAKRLLRDEEGRPVIEGNKPVYETYLYNKETGQPYTPQAPSQALNQNSVAAQQAQEWLQKRAITPTGTQHPATTRVAPGGGVDINAYFRNP